MKRVLLGRPIRTADAEHQRIPKVVGLAVFSSDAISSTAYATEEIMGRVEKVRHFGFLEKPVEEWQYKEAIESALEIHRLESKA